MSKTYSFEGYSLEMKNGEYIVLSNGSAGKVVELKTQNPILAVICFCGQIQFSLIKKVREYLKNQNKNQYTGCNQLELTCHECKLLGEFLNCNCPLECKEESDEQCD